MNEKEAAKRISCKKRSSRSESRNTVSLTTKNKDALMKNKFSQQNHSAWRPVLNCGTSLKYLRGAAVLYFLLGVIVFLLNKSVSEHTLDYTDCCDGSKPASSVSHCICIIEMQLARPIARNVYVYYYLSNYYQNFMAYGSSLDPGQMAGKTLNGSHTTCGPLYTIDHESKNPLAPCGEVANTLFNDTFQLDALVNASSMTVPLDRTSISWKFSNVNQNPKNAQGCGSLACTLNDTAKPFNWAKPLWQLDSNNENNNGYENEHLVGWLRIAPFGAFRKLYARVVHKQSLYFERALAVGRYRLTVDYNYPVKQFGRKSLILSNTSVLGGKNYFLAYLFLVTAFFFVILQFCFVYLHSKYDNIWNENFIIPKSGILKLNGNNLKDKM